MGPCLVGAQGEAVRNSTVELRFLTCSVNCIRNHCRGSRRGEVRRFGPQERRETCQETHPRCNMGQGRGVDGQEHDDPKRIVDWSQ